MIELALIGVFLGSLFQDHKCRVDEWSVWHPSFKYIGLLIGYSFEYADATELLLSLATQCRLYKYSMFAGIIIIWILSLIIPLLLLHIYRPAQRWGWCYLQSALLQILLYAFEKRSSARMHSILWLTNTVNKHYLDNPIPKINLLYILAIILAYITINKIIFIETAIPMYNAIFHTKIWLFNSLILLAWQINLICENKPELPTAREMRSTLHISKGYTLLYKTFFKWNFFYPRIMPWKFFHLMRLFCIYEIPPNIRIWRVSYSDINVYTRIIDCTCQILLVHCTDANIWPFLKPMTERGTYRYTKTCDIILSTSN